MSQVIMSTCQRD